MSGWQYFLVVAGMGVVTYLPRWLPLALLADRKLPPWLVQWLEMVPAAILGALIAPILLVDKSAGVADFSRPELWVAIPTLAFAWFTRSLAGTVLVGMALYWGVGFVL